MQKLSPKNDAQPEIRNPWLTVWYKPRATFRLAIEHKTMNLAIFLAIVAGIVETYHRAIAYNLGEFMPLSSILIVILLVGVIIGCISWFIGSAIFLGLGKLMKGQASFYEMLIAQGIALIPLSLNLIIFLVDLALIGEAMFQDVELSSIQVAWLLFSAIISFVLTIWTVFLIVKAIAETHRFSAWKGLLVFAIPILLMMIVAFFIVMSGILVGILLL